MRRRVGLRRLGLSLRIGVGQERRGRQATHGGVRHDRSRGRRVDIVSRCGIPRQIRPVRLAHVGVRGRGLTVMRLQRGESMRLGHRVLRLHGVLRHGHARDGCRGQRRGALG